MKKILAAMLCFLLALPMFTACAAENAAGGGFVRETDARQEAAVSAEGAQTGTVRVEDARVTSAKKEYVRQAADVPASERYVFRADAMLSASSGDYYFGLSAGANEIPQNMDLVYGSANGGELASYATLYNADKRYDLGYRRAFACGADPQKGMELCVIRDGALFYFLCEGNLMQVREFDIRASVPGFAAYNCTAAFANAEYSSDPAAVEKALEGCAAQAPQGGVGYCYSNFAGLVFGSGSVTFPEAAAQKPFEYTKTAFAGEYSGDVTVSFTTSGLKPNPAYDTAGNLWPKLALLISYENGYEDMLCIGVGKKQDRVETFVFTEFTQWHNHADFTGDTSAASAIDREGDIDFRIEIGDKGTFKTYRIYVNGALFALRTSKSYGPMTFGFASEYVAGTVKNFTVETRGAQA